MCAQPGWAPQSHPMRGRVASPSRNRMLQFVSLSSLMHHIPHGFSIPCPSIYHGDVIPTCISRSLALRSPPIFTALLPSPVVPVVSVLLSFSFSSPPARLFFRLAPNQLRPFSPSPSYRPMPFLLLLPILALLFLVLELPHSLLPVPLPQRPPLSSIPSAPSLPLPSAPAFPPRPFPALGLAHTRPKGPGQPPGPGSPRRSGSRARDHEDAVAGSRGHRPRGLGCGGAGAGAGGGGGGGATVGDHSAPAACRRVRPLASRQARRPRRLIGPAGIKREGPGARLQGPLGNTKPARNAPRAGAAGSLARQGGSHALAGAAARPEDSARGL